MGVCIVNYSIDKTIESVKMILNLNPVSNPMSQLMVDALTNSIESLPANQLELFVLFANANRKFENGESGYERFMSVFEKFHTEIKKNEKQRLLKQSESKLDFLIKSIGAISPKMKEMIDLVDSRKYSSKIINPHSPIFDKEYKYDYLIGTIKNYCSKTCKVYTIEIQKAILVEMFDRNILADEIYDYCDMHTSSISAKIEKLEKFKLSKEKNKLKIKEFLNLQSTYGWFRSAMIDQLFPIMPIIKSSLTIDYEADLDFSRFSKTKINGEFPFNKKAIQSLNAISFRGVYAMNDNELRDELRKTILNHNGFGKQIGDSSRVMALIEKATD